MAEQHGLPLGETIYRPKGCLQCRRMGYRGRVGVFEVIRITPKQEPLDVKEELRNILADCGLEGEVELYVYRPAFEADEKKGAPLKAAITRALSG